MIRRKRLFVALLLSGLVIQLFSFSAFAQNSTPFSVKPITGDPDLLTLNLSSSPVDSRELQSNLEESEQAYTNLFRSFLADVPVEERYQEDVYSVNGIPSGRFPDSYAGAYVNSDLNLVVQIKEDSAKTVSSLASSQQMLSAAADSSALIYTTAKFSYNDLVEAMDDVHQFQLSQLNKNRTTARINVPKFSVKYFAIDDYKNRVIVALDDISQDAIDSFKKEVSDSPVIEFVLDKSSVSAEDATLNPGGAIDKGSVAFRVYKQVGNNYIEGFVTAAHCYDTDDPVYVGNTIVADADVRQYGGNMDAVFCVLRPGHSAGTAISYIGGTLRSGIDANLAQGHPVTMVGQTTQGETGTVKSISYAYTYTPNNTYFYDLAAADYSRDGGDSGGIVISTRTGSNYIAGVHRGYHSPYALFSKAINITPGLNLTFNDGSQN